MRDTDPVAIPSIAGVLLLGLAQDARLFEIAQPDTQAIVEHLRQSRRALQDPIVAAQLRRLAARACVQIPTGLADSDALIDALAVGLTHRAIVGVFLARAPVGTALAGPAPKPGPTRETAFADMGAEQRIRLLLERTPKELAPDLARAFRSMVTTEALAGIAAAFALLLAAQFLGVGEVADAALAWWAYSQAGFAGLAGLYGALRAVVACVRAPDERAFDEAVKHFAAGLAVVGVALLTVLVTRAARKRAGGAQGGESSSFSRPTPDPTPRRWPIAPATKSATPAADVLGRQPEMAVPTAQTPADSPSYLYRGVGPNHPNFENYRNGDIIPGDVNGTVTPEDHNLYGDDPFVQSQSPYTSWTRDPALAASRAGDGGVLLQVPTGAPPPGAAWSWEWSPDEFGESEVLMKGTRSGAGVVQQ